MNSRPLRCGGIETGIIMSPKLFREMFRKCGEWSSSSHVRQRVDVILFSLDFLSKARFKFTWMLCQWGKGKLARFPSRKTSTDTKGYQSRLSGGWKARGISMRGLLTLIPTSPNPFVPLISFNQPPRRYFVSAGNPRVYFPSGTITIKIEALGKSCPTPY